MRFNRAKSLVFVLASCVLALSCTDDVTVDGKNPQTSDAGGADLAVSDATEPEDGSETPDALPDSAPDTILAELPPADVVIPVQPCEKNEECPTAACLPTPNGKQCAQTCTDQCPPDFQCQELTAASDVLFVCVHQAPYRCQPCNTDADCTGTKGKQGVCADLGKGGFCLQGCADGSACIGAGFQCGKADSGQQVCIPPASDGTPGAGQCPCPDGKTGFCKVKNEFGSCPGTYVCAAGLPGTCSGTTPAAEVCNGKDEDCDGATDEDVVAGACDLTNVYGTCKGQTLCVAGKVLCQGTQASAEVCNGIDDNCSGSTDEGSPDGDGDGKADCVDEDDDGDGQPDAADNCATVANAAQTDSDADSQGDACDTDDDNDKVLDTDDNCPLAGNATQADADADGKGDACDCDVDGDGVGNVALSQQASADCPADVTPDNCLLVPNAGQEDLDGDGQGDACDGDKDADGVANPADNCPALANAGQANNDKDAEGDLCDPDDDNDGALDSLDNCQLAANPTQTDLDGDLIGDECDSDLDGDGVDNLTDNCPGKANPDQVDANANKVGDTCENDWDSDGVANAQDLCPWLPDPAQADTDKDGKGDACDCDADGDGVANSAGGCAEPAKADLCPTVVNPKQEDLDSDGLGDACDADVDGDGDPNDSDCAPTDKAVSKLAKEACDGVDDDCDGQTDEEDATGCKPTYYDGDGDGAGVTLVKCLCGAKAPYTAPVAGDCNDQDGSIHPGAPEVCGNGQDDNCNGSENDEKATGCKVLFLDKDGDGYGTATSKCLCNASDDFTAKQGGDCNDEDGAMSPGQVEKCLDKKDNDCNKQVDEAGCQGCTTFFKDADGDGFGVDGEKKCLSIAGAPYTALKSGDCSDGDKAVSPAATEACNGKDDDCDAQTDEASASGCKTFYQDEDKDTFGTGSGQCLCKATGLQTAANASDCNDKDAAVNPSKAEICGNGKDDNCAGGETEENAQGCTKLFLDQDADGFGGGPSKCLCMALGGYGAKQAGDCDDKDSAKSPGLPEKCQDNKDNDCDAQTDEENCQGCITYYKDADTDGYGLTSDKKCLSAAKAPYTASQGGDCQDASKAVNPKATEACNSLDDDCDAQTDEAGATGCKAFFTDEDKDSFGMGTSQCLCAATGLVTASKDGDCNDKDPNVNPERSEVCGNGKDDNCVGAETDLDAGGCVNFFADGDGDGYGVGTAKCTCAPQGTYSAKQAGDCDDNAIAISPAQTEKCLDSKDNNCNGQTDEAGCQGCQTYFKDADQDGFGLDADKQCLGVSKYPYTAFIGGDCNDDPAKGGTNVKPGAAELCNSVDDNCDGQTDPTGTSGCQNFYPDGDKDGYGAQVSALCLCKATTTYPVSKTGDCNDADAAIKPSATEVCNAKDDNCNGQADEGVLLTFYKDQDGDGYGGPTTVQGCQAPSGYAANAGDCNDFNKAIFPKATEACNDLDDDCDSLVDEGLATQTIYKDNDGDKFAAAGASSMQKCNVPIGWAISQDVDKDGKPDWDCVDSDVTVFPGAPDVCGDGKDNDCNGSADKLCYTTCAGTWPYQLQYSSGNHAAKPVDLDGDGNFEVVVQDSFGFAVLNTAGKALYAYSAPNYNYSRSTVTLADLDTFNTFGAGTQGLELITGNGSKARVYFLKPDGTLQMVEHPDQVMDASRTLVGDLDYNGTPELIYTNWCDKNANTKVFRYDTASASLKLLSSIPDPDGVCAYYTRLLTDLNGDGAAELLVGNGYQGDGGAVSTTTWAGKVYAYKLTDAAGGKFGDWCSPAGTCAFNTAIANLYGVQVSGLYRFGDEIQASILHSATKVQGQTNATQTWHHRFDLAGKAVTGSPSTATSLAFPTDVDDDGVVETNSLMGEHGLWDVDGDGFPDQIYVSGAELRVALWTPAKKAFVEHVPSRAVISNSGIGLRGVWDFNGDGRVDVTAVDSAGKVYCQQLGQGTFNKKTSLPPHLTPYLRTNQWDNFEPNPGTDTNADGLPDRLIRLASAVTRKGNFYGYLSSAGDVDAYMVDTNWGSSICLQAPKGREYSLKVYGYADKWNNATKAAGADGKPDGLLWTGKTGVGGQVCFNGTSVTPFRHGEYKFAISVEAVSGFSPYWPYWITANK